MDQDRRSFDVAGIETCVYDTGPRPGAPTVVMLHGGDPRSLANALDWSTVWDPTGLDARLVAYDKPGQGLTYSAELPDEAMSAPRISAHLEALLDTLGEEPVVLVGHSRGALPVADVATRRPERVRGLVLVSSNTLAPHSPLTPADFYPRAYADPPPEPTVEYVRREPEMNSWGSDHVDDVLVAGRMRGARSNGWWQDLPRRSRVSEEVVRPSLEPLRARVLDDVAEHGLAMPVLQVWGQEDVSAPVALAHALFATIARRTPQCASLVLNRSGHYVYRERAHAFRVALRVFLDELR